MITRLFLTSILGIGASAWSESPLEPILNDSFHDEISGIFEKYDAPGMSVAVVHDGKTVYARAFGVKDIETGDAMTTDAQFHWASVTKPFVATAIVQLVEDGKIDLDKPVVEYLPYFKLADDRYREITVRQMLSHSSGMPDVSGYEWHKPQYDDGALERYVRSIADKELIAAPGEKTQYSNMAYEVLGDVIAKVSGVSFEEYVAANILAPLKMKDSTLLKKEVNETLLTSPHARTRNGPKVRTHWPYNRIHAPSSCMISNVNDMARWAMANLNRGELDGERILDEASYDLMWKPGSSASDVVGLSWFLREESGFQTVSHGGSDDGFRSIVMMVPAHDFGLVAVVNGDYDITTRVARAGLKALDASIQ